MKTMTIYKNDPKWLKEDFPCYELEETLIYKNEVCVVNTITGNNDEVKYHLLSLDEYFEFLKSDFVLKYQGVPCTLKELEALNKELKERAWK